jgi:hypothetical protein
MSRVVKQSLKEGFERFVIRKSEGCWDWSGCCASPGYGQFKYGMKKERCHRASWMIHYGEIPKGMFVCHTCDNKKCANPKHLFLGTCEENNRDMMKKNRSPILGKSGEANPRCKLTQSQVIEIKEMLKNKMPQFTIANFFNVSQALISLIKLERVWR